MAAADHFRKQAEALHSLAKQITRSAERLEIALAAMECEARAVDAERGKIVPPYLSHANFSRHRPSPSNQAAADPGSRQSFT